MYVTPYGKAKRKKLPRSGTRVSISRDMCVQGLCEGGLKSGFYLFQGLALQLFIQGDKAAFTERPSTQKPVAADETLVLINILWAYRHFFSSAAGLK